MVPMEALLSKRVQEMVLNGDEPPPPYVCRDDESIQNVPPALCSIPIIDFELLSSSTKQKQELQKLRSALSSWGCFQVHHIFIHDVLFSIPMNYEFNS